MSTVWNLGAEARKNLKKIDLTEGATFIFVLGGWISEVCACVSVSALPGATVRWLWQCGMAAVASLLGPGIAVWCGVACCGGLWRGVCGSVAWLVWLCFQCGVVWLLLLRLGVA